MMKRKWLVAGLACVAVIGFRGLALRRHDRVNAGADHRIETLAGAADDRRFQRFTREAHLHHLPRRYFYHHRATLRQHANEADLGERDQRFTRRLARHAEAQCHLVL